jgi:hypothetical protein
MVLLLLKVRLLRLRGRFACWCFPFGWRFGLRRGFGGRLCWGRCWFGRGGGGWRFLRFTSSASNKRHGQ